MKQRASQILNRAKETVPEGTGAVGAGLLVSAITAYVFVIVSLNALSGGSKSAFSAFWALLFVAGPGFYLPLEQEVGRALAHRRAQGIGGGPLVVRAAKLGGAITAVLVVASLALTPVLMNSLYHGDALFAVALAIGLVSFYLLHLVRGTLAGNGRFRAYGEMLAADGIIRLVAALVLVFAGVHVAGAYALCLALAPFAAVAFALRRQRGLLPPGPEAPYVELSANLGWLLAGSVLMQSLAYAPLLGINILAKPDQEDITAAFASAFFVARVPVLAFQAVQGTLLPKLAGLVGAGRHDEFKAGFRKLLALVVAIAVLGTVGALTLGGVAGRLLFKDFTISNSGLALLAAGSGAFIIALTVAQALIAVEGQRATAISWGVGVVVCIGGIAAISDLQLRVEIGFLAGALVAAAAMGWSLHRRLLKVQPTSIEPLITAIEHEPIEI